MGKYRRLLISFDGSESSRNALKQAIKLAGTDNEWIEALSVMPTYEGDLELVGISDIQGVLKGPTGKLLDEARGIAVAEGAEIITEIEHGKVYERIVDAADKKDCDLIVMGRKGLQSVKRMLMGSVTSRVIGHAHKDVLVVPMDASIGCKKILLATDGSKYGMAAAEHAVNFASSYGGDLTAVSVVYVTDEFYAQAPHLVEQMVEKAKGFLEDIKKKAEASGVKIETAVREGEAYEKIVDLADEKSADIIFMGSHGRTGIEKLLMGSVTEKVIGHASCPVMVVRP